MKQGLHIAYNGHQYWYLNGQLHRTDGPAVIYTNGTQFWYQYNKLHRTDGPAIIYSDNDKRWWINGEFIANTETKFHNHLIKQNLHSLL